MTEGVAVSRHGRQAQHLGERALVAPGWKRAPPSVGRRPQRCGEGPLAEDVVLRAQGLQQRVEIRRPAGDACLRRRRLRPAEARSAEAEKHGEDQRFQDSLSNGFSYGLEVWRFAPRRSPCPRVTNEEKNGTNDETAPSRRPTGSKKPRAGRVQACASETSRTAARSKTEFKKEAAWRRSSTRFATPFEG